MIYEMDQKSNADGEKGKAKKLPGLVRDRDNAIGAVLLRHRNYNIRGVLPVSLY